jgi:transposase
MLKEIQNEMKGLLKQIPYAQYILSIHGIGPLSAAIFLGELGDPGNFKNARQIIKYSGYDPQERDSGQRVGRKRISKKGRWLLRKTLFFMGMRVVVKKGYFKDYYQRKLETKNRFDHLIKKKEGLCAVVIKLIKVMFALMRDRRMFDDKADALPLAA